jgi:spore germination cell wall hydrolase CwlJ-like protein
MNRIVRAAGFAVAAVALVAAGGMPSPSQAEAANGAPAAQLGGHADAALDESELALNDIDAAPAAATPDQPGFFAQMWSHARAAVLGDDAPATDQPQRQSSLTELVAAYAGTQTGDREHECLANAVYFEARGETIEGQLAVAEVVLNRAASGRYPSDLCAVITQPWQFSFIVKGRFPQADRSSDAWSKAVAIAQIARQQLADSLPSDVLWYHADYVAPSWGKRLNKQAKIGLHIFYS